MHRRDVLRATGVAAAATLAGCGGESGQTPTDDLEGTVVEVGPDGRFAFVPGTEEPLRIPAGETVTWVWRSRNHNVVVDRQPDGADWDGHEPIENAGFTHSHTFEIAGEYRYYCQPHRSAGMVADLVVE